ncbi:MAG TPA: nucleotidyltransferase domain-containing protein [Candidatus Avalokitesvara rifleensis]|uniref:nucleotidyltransferase domain-containing protein n=1 Tax=Candidatus Avalokitesvara rifleensis TaxID=3367620 RepID=UPI0027138CEC|nr:nucleotidyltransferase domain-containing protein [Candidatus Brocadiales bacterium]
MNNENNTGWKEALKDFTQRVSKLYGNKLESVILYGSHAREEATEQSDIDLLIVLKDFKEFWEEFHRVSPIASSISLKHNVVISAIPMKKEEYESKITPLLLNVKREGKVVV